MIFRCSYVSIIPQVKALCWFRKQARGYAQTGDMIFYSGSSYEMILVILVLWQVEASWHFHENDSVPVEAPKQAHIKPKRVLENTVKLRNIKILDGSLATSTKYTNIRRKPLKTCEKPTTRREFGHATPRVTTSIGCSLQNTQSTSQTLENLKILINTLKLPF